MLLDLRVTIEKTKMDSKVLQLLCRMVWILGVELHHRVNIANPISICILQLW